MWWNLNNHLTIMTWFATDKMVEGRHPGCRSRHMTVKWAHLTQLCALCSFNQFGAWHLIRTHLCLGLLTHPVVNKHVLSSFLSQAALFWRLWRSADCFDVRLQICECLFIDGKQWEGSCYVIANVDSEVCASNACLRDRSILRSVIQGSGLLLSLQLEPMQRTLVTHSNDIKTSLL